MFLTLFYIKLEHMHKYNPSNKQLFSMNIQARFFYITIEFLCRNYQIRPADNPFTVLVLNLPRIGPKTYIGLFQYC